MQAGKLKDLLHHVALLVHLLQYHAVIHPLARGVQILHVAERLRQRLDRRDGRFQRVGDVRDIVALHLLELLALAQIEQNDIGA